MKKNEKMYVIIFDKHTNFKEIHVLSKSSDPFVVNPKSVGDQIYIYNQKEFKKIIESAMRHLTTQTRVDYDAGFVNITTPTRVDIDDYNKYIIQHDSRIINNTNKVTKGTTIKKEQDENIKN